jgi:hypothetical protein
VGYAYPAADMPNAELADQEHDRLVPYYYGERVHNTETSIDRIISTHIISFNFLYYC